MVIVRYGEEQFISNFRSNIPGLMLGDKCVIRTDRGTEIGTVISQPEPLNKPDNAAARPAERERSPERSIGAERERGATAESRPNRESPERSIGAEPKSQTAPNTTMPGAAASCNCKRESGDPSASPLDTASFLRTLTPQDESAERSSKRICESPGRTCAGPEQTKMSDVLRKLTPQDHEELRRIEKEKKPAALKFCQEKVKALNLPMKIAFVEYMLGGEKIIFYFMAEGRVDFRELVKELAKEYKTRIEMHQVGVRDEAKLLGDIGHCGHTLCCKTCVKELEPITMKMAKVQKTTLDPSKISGYCGRLMCCLRFEDEYYTQLRNQLPRKGAVIKTAKGVGEVINIDILSQSLIMEIEGGEKVKVVARDILEIIKEPTLKVTEEEQNHSAERERLPAPMPIGTQTGSPAPSIGAEPQRSPERSIGAEPQRGAPTVPPRPAGEPNRESPNPSTPVRPDAIGTGENKGNGGEKTS